MKYNITAKLLKGYSIVGYRVLDESGKKLDFSVEEVKRLLRSGAILNCKLIEHGGKEYIYLTNITLNELDSVDMVNDAILPKSFEATQRIVSDNKTIGYTLRNNKNELLRYPISKVWGLAHKYKIINMRAKLTTNREKILLGHDINLNDITIVEIKK